MKIFNYTTHKGTKVEVIVKTSNDITLKANGKEFKSNGSFYYDFMTNPPTPALGTDFKVNGKTLSIGVTEEIKTFIKGLKEEFIPRIEKDGREVLKNILRPLVFPYPSQPLAPNPFGRR